MADLAQLYPLGDSTDTLSATDVAQAAYNAGARGLALVVATAVALTEDPARAPGVLNNTPSTGDYSVGLWQINYFGNLAPERSAKYGPPAAITSAEANARAAADISGGWTNFGAWTTYTSGAYSSHLSEAASAAASIDPSAASAASTAGIASLPQGTTAGISGPFGGGAWNPFGAIGSALGTDLAKIALTGLLVAGGVALVVVGATKSFQATATGQKVTQAATESAKYAAAG